MKVLWSSISSVLSIGTFFYKGFIFMMLWNWFLVEVGVIPISYALSLGMIALIGFVTFRHGVFQKLSLIEDSIKIDDEEKEFKNMILGVINVVSHSLVLLIGFIIQSFV